ncbi:MAG: hypothetical protein IJ723_06300, partial [Ruminococcus sp.]|nr:hypothetical protein [Ruminococcus sp.]
MNQEKLMKRRMVTAIIAWIVTFITLLVFIGLYIDETHRVQETYRKQYLTEIKHASQEIEAYIDNQGDLDLRYKRIIYYMSAADSYAFLINDFTDQQIVVNELSTCFVKYPEQMSEKLEETKEALDEMYANHDKGYKAAEEIVDAI